MSAPYIFSCSSSANNMLSLSLIDTVLSLASMSPLSNHCAGRRALISPSGWQNSDGLVVSRQTVDTGFDEDKAEFGILVFAVALEVLADGNSLKYISIGLSL